MRHSSKLLALTVVVAAVAVGLAMAPRQADAATANGSFTVTANVARLCTVAASAVTVTYDPFDPTANTFTNAVNVTCTKGVTFNTTIASSNTPPFTLKGTSTPSNNIPYSVNQTNSSGADWKTTPFPGTSSSKNTPISQVAFFTIASGIDVPADSYVDTINVTVNY
jgi:spore coat protein U-like protein